GDVRDGLPAGPAPGGPELDDVRLAGLELLDLLPFDPARDGELRRGVADVEDLVRPRARRGEAEGGRGEDGQVAAHDGPPGPRDGAPSPDDRGRRSDGFHRYVPNLARSPDRSNGVGPGDGAIPCPGPATRSTPADLPLEAGNEFLDLPPQWL